MIEDKPLPWQEMLEIFFRRRRLILLAGAIGLLATGLTTVLTPPVYLAKAKVLLTEQAVSGPREEGGSESQIKAELHHLKSPALVRAVLEFYQETGQPLRPAPPPLDRMGTALTRATAGVIGRIHQTPPPTNVDLRVQELLPNIEPRSISDTNVIEIAHESTDPKWAARFVNDLLDQHIKRIARFNEEARASNFYLEQRNLLYVRWKEAQDTLSEYRNKYGTNLLEGDDDHLRKVLSQLESSRVETETQLLEHQAKVDYLNEQLVILPEQISAEQRFTEDESVKSLKSHLLDLEMKRSELLSRYTPTSIRVGEIERQIEETKALLIAQKDVKQEELLRTPNPSFQTLKVELVQTQARLVSAQARVEALNAQILDYRNRLNHLEQMSTELQRLRNDVKNKEDAHQRYLQKEEEARLSSSLDESGIVNLSIFERAETPIAPEPSKAKLLMAAGAIGGLLLGALLGIVRDFLDPTVKSSAQAWRLSQAPILAEIARD
jgi:uncharacterized protein involved in exopolysaccharide biosynthesis